MDPVKASKKPDWSNPERHCDLVMKGGITSGVIYPTAIAEFAKEYRLHGIGGSSAGAIGASLAAAAEYGRFSRSGGFGKLVTLPSELGRDHGLRRLFRPQWGVKGLFYILRGVTEKSPFLFVVGLLPAVLLALGLGVLAIAFSNGSGFWAVAGTVSLIVIGLLLFALVFVFIQFMVLLPANQFGICRGAATPRRLRAGHEELTDWLSRNLDELAGLPKGARPLTFEQLLKVTKHPMEAAGLFDNVPRPQRAIELRMVASCLSRARPYEFPLESDNFFFEEKVWRRLFPDYVVDALLKASPTRPPRRGTVYPRRPVSTRWRQAEIDQEAYNRKMYRLPVGAALPVIVAVRMSLSFPLLISAIPLWTYPEGVSLPERKSRSNARMQPFQQLWFMDGGLCSNFPLNLFEKTLPTRPTFAINLGRFDDDTLEKPPEREAENVFLARSNSGNTRAPYRDIQAGGPSAVTGFVAAIFDTMRNWQDNSYLTMPGYRDRIVQILQSKRQGGLNLSMDEGDIGTLAYRGRVGASELADQFMAVHYPNQKTGWDNQVWTRYRALLSVLPDFLTSYHAGRPLVPPAIEGGPPGYALTSRTGIELEEELLPTMLDAAEAVERNPSGVKSVQSRPRPKGRLRRVSTF